MISVNTCGSSLPRAKVIEEKQRLRAEHGDVVHAMIHEVGANGVVLDPW